MALSLWENDLPETLPAMSSTPPQAAELRFAHPLPYGAILHDGGVQFVVFSRSATAMRVLLYEKPEDPDPCEVIDFDPDLNRWGDIWSVFVPAEGGIIRPPKCVVIDDEFDWQGDRHLRRPLSETIIYEMHVRGFTRARSSGVAHPGTYQGIIEKIPYLQSLGVTAVELMPVQEFPILDCLGQKPERSNYWGYDPLAFFAPHRGYASGNEPGCQVREFKQMVRALHQAGIEVILDVVFNHTAEGNELGPVLSFKGLENRVYYMLADGGRTYRNYSGCGNRSGFDPQPRPRRQPAAQSSGGRGHRRRPPAGRHQDHRRGLGRRRGLSGGHLRRHALGRMEREVSRRCAALLAGRPAHDRPPGHPPGRFERPL